MGFSFVFLRFFSVVWIMHWMLACVSSVRIYVSHFPTTHLGQPDICIFLSVFDVSKWRYRHIYNSYNYSNIKIMYISYFILHYTFMDINKHTPKIRNLFGSTKLLNCSVILVALSLLFHKVPVCHFRNLDGVCVLRFIHSFFLTFFSLMEWKSLIPIRNHSN